MVQRKQVDLTYNDGPGATELEILTLPLGINPSFGTIRNGLQLLASYVSEEVRIPRPTSSHDCTGQTFTSGIELMRRSIEPSLNQQGNEEYVLIAIYHHSVRVDV